MRHLRTVALAACASLFMVSAAEAARRPRPTPPPPPPPPAQFPLTASAQFDAAAGASVIVPNGYSPYIERVGATGLGGVKISYDKASGAYTVRDPAYGFASPSLRRTGTSGIYDVHSRSSRGIVDEIRIYNPARAAAGAVPLTYVNFGMWTHREGTPATTRQYAFVYGYPTSESAMPRSGTASYRTMVNGSSIAVGSHPQTREIGGTASFNVDFAAGTVSTQLNLAYIGSGQPSIPTYSGSGSISANQFGGSLTSSDYLFVGGSFAGAFFGPNAQEMGYSFGIMRHNWDPYAGAFVNFYDEAIVGSVVGTRN